jgi:histidinol-phosphate aminotransferase
VLGNGSNQLLKLIAQAYVAPGDEVIYSQYSFALYPIISQALGSRGVEVKANQWGCDLTAMAQAVNQQTKLIFLANPNNPTGTYCGKASFIRFMGQLPESVLVVLDEAYFDYLEQGRPGADYFTGLSLLDLFPNLIVTRTFSKAYGLAGLHIGYAVANRQIARLLNTVRTPFNVNSLSQIAAKTALADQAHIRQSYQLNLQGKAQLEKCFNQWGLAYIPSVANFISVETGRSAQSVQQALLAQGVVVRDLTSYQMPGHVRVTVGLPDENDRFLQALKRVLNEGEVSS